jgi:signal transduction histidine kinase
VRQRILRTTLGISLTVIVLMTIVMLWGDWAATTRSAENRVEQQADRVAALLHDINHAPGTLTAADLDRVRPADYRVELVTSDGTLQVAGDTGVDGPAATEIIADLGRVTVVDVSGSLARSHVLSAVIIVGGGVLIALLAVVLAVRSSRRITEPLTDLVHHADRLGLGDLRASGRRYGVSELDQLAASMDAAVTRIAGLLAQERRLTLDASHQLKTPLTALSLRLEELAECTDDTVVRAEAGAALEQVERLAGVVDELLVDRRSPEVERLRQPLPAVVEQQVREWRPAFDAVGRDVRMQWSATTPAFVEAGPVGQVVSALIENSLVHGAGTTTVTVGVSDAGSRGSSWVEVGDEGEGVAEDIAARIFDRDVSGSGGTGLGLAAAQDTAVSVGGRLALVRREPAHFRFFLGREDPASVGPESEERAEADADDVAGDVVRES